MTEAPPAPLLDVAGVGLRFGALVALEDISFEVQRGTCCALIGPNGAGKTSLFNCISRFYEPHQGEIRLDGHDLLSGPAYRIGRLGVARTFQEPALILSMSVLENVRLGTHRATAAGPLRGALRTPAARRTQRRADEDCRRALRLVGIEGLGDRRPGELSYGQQKRVELARALALQPELLLLDEPAGGLAHGEVDALGGVLEHIKAELELTILLVEHNMALVMGISDHIVVLDGGRVIADGPPQQIRDDPAVIEAYLGTSQGQLGTSHDQVGTSQGQLGASP